MKQSVAVARLVDERQKLIKSINQNRRAEDEIVLENTEDEGDLAFANHTKELARKLGEASYKRLLEISAALKRTLNDEHNDCEECGDPIGDKRLNAVPWATLCIGCQSQAEMAEDAQGVRAFAAHAEFET